MIQQHVIDDPIRHEVAGVVDLLAQIRVCSQRHNCRRSKRGQRPRATSLLEGCTPVQTSAVVISRNPAVSCRCAIMAASAVS